MKLVKLVSVIAVVAFVTSAFAQKITVMPAQTAPTPTNIRSNGLKPTAIVPRTTTTTITNEAGAVTSIGTPLAAMPMIVSRAVMREYTIGLAASINIGIGGSGIVDYGYEYRDWPGRKSLAEIGDILRTITIACKTVDPTQSVLIYGSVNGVDGDVLFHAYTDNKALQSGGTWSLPTTAGDLSFRWFWTPIDMGKDVGGAGIVQKDSDGNLNYYPIFTSGRRIYFPEPSAGLLNAYLQVNFADGTIVAYTIADGKKINEVTLKAMINPSFENALIVKNPISNSTISHVAKVDSRNVGVVPLFEVTNTSGSGYFVLLDAATNTGKRPVRVWSKMQTSATWSATTVPATGVTNIPITVGVSYHIPEWLTSDLNEAPYPVSNGGK